MSKTQRWDWAIGLDLNDLNDQHLQAAYKLNWDNLCKFDSCRKNCKKILCLGCFDRSWIDNDSANNSFDSYDAPTYDQKRTNLKTFVGLKNLGATCYVNCLLQLWFHNPALRKAIYEWKITDDFSHVQNNKTKRHQSVDDGNSQILQICDVKNRIPQQSNNNINEIEDTNTKTNTISQSKRALEDIDESCSSPCKKTNSQQVVDISLSNKIFSNSVENVDQNQQLQESPKTKKTTIKQQSSTNPTESNNETQNCQLPKELVQNNPIQQLQLIFARLQFTNKKSIDPFNFIDSLALNAAEQQDAQEFGNLFMEFLERSFSGQKNKFVSKIIQDQFCGRYSYATICDSCKHSSLSDSKFYELDLSIQNLETLYDCLNEYFRPVVLDGKYNCGHCQKAQSAHRKIILKSLPPTLNLQLLRFVYDVQRNVRQKLNSHIIFPEVLDMNPYLSTNNMNGKSRSHSITHGGGSQNNNNNNSITRQQYQQQQLQDNHSNIYFLSAVLIHRGSSPHSGHYIAHIKDRISKDWYKFNDDSVERIGPQLQVSTDGENISIVEDKTEYIKIADTQTGKVTRLESKSLKSKTAYMLVYQAQDNEALGYPSDNSEKWQLPEHLQTAVVEENSRSDEIFESIQLAREVDLQIMDARKNQIRNLYTKLVCRGPNDKFEFISKKWLQNWLTNSSTSAKFHPIDNSDLLCHHQKLDFRKIDQVKCVNSEGADELYKEYGGGPRLVDAMCKECVLLEIKLIQLKDRMKEDQKFITSQAKFKLDANYDFNDAYIVGKNSYRDWQALVMVQFKKEHPELLKRKEGGKSANTEASNPNGESEDEDQKMSKENQEPKAIANSILTNNDAGSDSESEDESIEKFVFNSDILCDHGQLVNDTNAWRIVPKEVWWIFKNYFGSDPERPLIEYNANTIMCAECKKQEVEQQEIGDIQKQKAQEQKTKLPDLFHNRKRASWCSMVPGDVYYALDRNFLMKWQKFIRNPCNVDQPTTITHSGRLICEHGKSIYDHSNSNPVLPECPFVLISREELNILKTFYPIDHEIKFTISQDLVPDKIGIYLTSQQKQHNSSNGGQNCKQKQLASPSDGGIRGNGKVENNDDSDSECYMMVMKLNQNSGQSRLMTELSINNELNETQSSQLTLGNQQQSPAIKTASNYNAKPSTTSQEDIDLTEIDWSDCVISEPRFCSDCHKIMKEHELKKLLNYETATIYITKVENATPPISGSTTTTTPTTTTTNGTSNNNNNSTNYNNDCDIDSNNHLETSNYNSSNNTNNSNGSNVTSTGGTSLLLQIRPKSSADNVENMLNPSGDYDSSSATDDPSRSKRRAKIYTEDEANDFVPPGIIKQQQQQVASQQSTPSASSPASNGSLLRRTTRRNRNRQQAYNIKPTQTLLELKKEIFSRCQVLPVDQRLFLNDILLDDNSKTMSELKIVPNCSLKLEVDKPVGDIIDLIEDEPNSRKSYAQPETGFKGSLLLSSSHS